MNTQNILLGEKNELTLVYVMKLCCGAAYIPHTCIVQRRSWKVDTGHSELATFSYKKEVSWEKWNVFYFLHITSGLRAANSNILCRFGDTVMPLWTFQRWCQIGKAFFFIYSALLFPFNRIYLPGTVRALMNLAVTHVYTSVLPRFPYICVFLLNLAVRTASVQTACCTCLI